MPAPRAYRFEQFRLDLAKQRVTGMDGRALVVPGRAYEVLLFLIEHCDRVVTKDELLRAVWPHTVVEENNLNQAVSSLRRALGDSRETPRLILTIAGRGYRFIGDAQPESTAEVPRPTTASAAKVRSVAVLPFQPLLQGSGDAALEIGMADTLINRLSTLPGLAITPLSSVRRYAGSDISPLAAGRELDVASVVEGHVQVRDGRVQLNARLLQVADGTAIWSGSFNERLVDFFSVQESLTRQLAQSLSAHLTDEACDRIVGRETSDLEAWQLYLNGRYQWSRRDRDGLERAIDCYQAASNRDPKFAAPVAGLADSWAVLGVFNALPPGEVFPKARAAAERAIALDPLLAEGHAALGHVLVQYDCDWQGGERLYRKALELNPRYAQATMWLANCCLYQHRHAEALREGQHAQALEPTSLAYAANVGMIRYFLRDFDTAYAQLESLTQIAPVAFLPRRHLARLHVVRGEGEKALAMLDGLPEIGPGYLSDRGRALAVVGNVEAAREELSRIEALGRKGFGVGYDLALVHMALGQRAQAIDALELAARDHSQMLGLMNSEPALDPLRHEPRVRAVSRARGLPD